MSTTWSRSSRATPRVPGVTSRSGASSSEWGPLYIGRLQGRPSSRRRAGATRSRPEVVPFRVYSRTEHLCSSSRARTIGWGVLQPSDWRALTLGGTALVQRLLMEQPRPARVGVAKAAFASQ